MKKIVTYLKNHKRSITLIGVVVLFIVSAQQADAIMWIAIDSMIGGALAIFNLIISAVNSLLGYVLIGFTNLFVMIAQYNDYATSPVISSGWALVRDVSNMFIVVGLLVIAFMSAFSSKSEYNLTRGLGMFIAAAILVNFSKMITLLAIDVSQVITLTFVNAFKEVAAGNIMTIFGIEAATKVITTSSSGEIIQTQSLAIAQNIFGVIMLVVTNGVIIGLMALFLVRVIALWFLVVTSPFAFAAMAIPVKKFGGLRDKWMTELGNWLTLGPMLAFVVWLSFTTVQQASKVFVGTPAGSSEALGGLGAPEKLAGFVLATGMLLYGIKYSIEVSGSAGKVFGKVQGKAQDYQKRFGLRSAKFAGQLAGAVGTRAMRAGAEFGEERLAAGREVGGVRGFMARARGAINVAPSRATNIAKRGVEFVREGNIEETLGGITRRVAGIEGAGDAAASERRKRAEKRASEEYSGYSSTELGSLVNTLQAGGLQDLTFAQQTALVRQATEKGVLRTPTQVNTALNALYTQAGTNRPNLEYMSQFERDVRERVFSSPNSIHRNPTRRVQNGQIVEDNNLIQRNAAEQISDLDEREVFSRTNFDDFRLDGYLDENGVMRDEVRNDPSLLVSKAGLLSFNVDSVARNGSQQNKERLGNQLIDFLGSGVILTDEEKSRALDILAATQIDARDARNMNRGEFAQEVVQQRTAALERLEVPRPRMAGQTEEQYRVRELQRERALTSLQTQTPPERLIGVDPYMQTELATGGYGRNDEGDLISPYQQLAVGGGPVPAPAPAPRPAPGPAPAPRPAPAPAPAPRPAPAPEDALIPIITEPEIRRATIESVVDSQPAPSEEVVRNALQNAGIEEVAEEEIQQALNQRREADAIRRIEQEVQIRVTRGENQEDAFNEAYNQVINESIDINLPEVVARTAVVDQGPRVNVVVEGIANLTDEFSNIQAIDTGIAGLDNLQVTLQEQASSSGIEVNAHPRLRQVQNEIIRLRSVLERGGMTVEQAQQEIVQFQNRMRDIAS